MRTYDHNGETREISIPSMSDSEIADRVMREGDGYASIRIAARDRILCLAKEKAELEREARSILVSHEDLATKYRSLVDDLLESRSQQSQLLGDFLKVHDALHRVLCVFVPGNYAAASLCSNLLKDTAAKWIGERRRPVMKVAITKATATESEGGK